MKEGPASRDKVSAVALCKAINGLSSRWKVEEIRLGGKTYWKVVWVSPKRR
jgi:hypothetical protein